MEDSGFLKSTDSSSTVKTWLSPVSLLWYQCTDASLGARFRNAVSAVQHVFGLPPGQDSQYFDSYVYL